MKRKKFLAFSMAALSLMASCSDDDNDDEVPSPVVPAVTVESLADAIAGSYIDSLSYTVGTMSNGTIQNDTLIVSKVDGKDDLVNLHFLKYMGMGNKSSELYIYNVSVSGSEGNYTLSVNSDQEAPTKAQMTGSKYDVTKIEGEVSKDQISLNFDFLIAAMNATFSNEYKNGKKL